MISPYPQEIPGLIALLPDSAVAKYLTRGIQTGQEKPPQVTLGKASIPLPEGDPRGRTEPVRELVDEAMRRFDGKRTEADGWLAPRLHATLRLTRAEAADRRRWNFFSMLVAPDYVVWRHKGDELAVAERFSGAHFTQAFARLWWTAELFRDGEDYSLIEIACRYQDALQSILRLDVIDHRPTAIAMIRVIERLIAKNASRVSDRVNALSSAVNAAASTLVYDVIALDDPPDDEALRSWIAEAEEAPPVPWDRLPSGADDGAVSKTAVDRLIHFFEQLLEGAPLRERKKASTEH